MAVATARLKTAVMGVRMPVRKCRVSDLTGPVLDYLVSKANNPPGKCGLGWFERDPEGYLFDPLNERRYSPSTDWSQGGPIIERERIAIKPNGCLEEWHANTQKYFDTWHFGPTPLIAAMRCFVGSELGDEVEVPEELFNG